MLGHKAVRASVLKTLKTPPPQFPGTLTYAKSLLFVSNSYMPTPQTPLAFIYFPQYNLFYSAFCHILQAAKITCFLLKGEKITQLGFSDLNPICFQKDLPVPSYYHFNPVYITSHNHSFAYTIILIKTIYIASIISHQIIKYSQFS